MAIIWIKLDAAESYYDASQSVLITSDQVAAVTDTPYVQKAINDGAIQEATEQEYDDYIASIPTPPVIAANGKIAVWSDSYDYEQGQMVYVSGRIYGANSDIASGTAFVEGEDPNQWTRLTDTALTTIVNAHDQSLAYLEGQVVLKDSILYSANSDIAADTVFAEGVAADQWTAIQTKEDSSITDKDSTTTTASLVYVDMSDMSKTPLVAGTYLVQFSATVSNSDGTKSVTVQLVDGNAAAVSASKREISCTTANEKHQVGCMGVITVDGLTSIKVQWKVAGGTGSCYQRQMLVTRIA